MAVRFSVLDEVPQELVGRLSGWLVREPVVLGCKDVFDRTSIQDVSESQFKRLEELKERGNVFCKKYFGYDQGINRDNSYEEYPPAENTRKKNRSVCREWFF